MARHDVAVELYYSGTWHDHAATDEVYTGDADNGADIKVSYGRGAETGGITPASVSLVLRGWRFNPENVTGDLYGLIGRNTPIRITVDGDVRFAGEVASWTPRQSLGGDVQVPDRWVEVEAGGILRRLEAGKDPLPSSLKTYYTTASPAPVAYWPLDGGQLSREGLPAIGAAAFNVSDGGARFSAGDMAPWLETAVEVGDGTVLSSIAGAVVTSATANRWAADHMRRNGGDVRGLDFQVIGNGQSSGGERYDWVLDFNPSTGEIRFFQLLITPASMSSVLLDTFTGTDAFDDRPHHFRMQLNQDGATIDWEVTMDGVSLGDGTVLASTMQGVSAVRLNSFTDPASKAAAVSHIAVFEGSPPSLADTVEAAFGYPGETAGDRFGRLSGESGVAWILAGDADESAPMGPQFQGTIAAQYAEIEATDDGIMADDPLAAVIYKTGRDRYNQAPTLTLDYAAFEVAPPLHPVLDDKRIRNDVTVARREGGDARAVDAASVAAIGRYTDSVDVNVFSDLVLDAGAGWRLHIGTVGADGARFERLTVDLDACPHLIPAVVATGIGDRVTVEHLPAELTPNTASLLVIGWTETIAPDRRKITFNCIPEAAVHVAELDHATYATTGPLLTEVSGPHSATTTSLTISPNGDGPWIHESDYDIVVAGERMTVTAALAAGGTFPSQTQVLTVVRSVNGVVKAIAHDAPVRLFQPAYIGL